MPENKLRLIQCGVGGFGASWVQSIVSASPDFELVGIVDLVEKNLHESGEAIGLTEERRFKTLEAALDAVETDAILTVTPPPVHIEHAKIAFSRGLHLMTEKPIADTIENAKLMVQLARQAGKQLTISQNYRYRPFIQKLRQLLADRVLGEFGHGHLDFYMPADFTGTFRETMEFPLLIDMAIHHFDLIRAVTGRNITRVTAHSFSPPWSWYKHDPGLKMLLELEGGLPFSYSGDWGAHGRCTTWNGTWRLQCAEGSLHLEADEITIARCDKWSKNPVEEAVEPSPLPTSEREATLHRFAQAIRTGRPAETNGADNLHSFGAVMAAVTSAREGRTVPLAEILGA